MNYVFDKTWFSDHQRILLWLLNAPVIKYWFRWVLRIRKKDCSIKEKIHAIAPNHFSFGARMVLADHLIFKNGSRKLYNPNDKMHRYWKTKCKTEKHLAMVQTTDFRTHNKYSKRLFHAFYPLWVAMHIWDLFADHYAPELSFGFSTLTVYPDSGTGSTTTDGDVYRSVASETFGTIRAGAGNGVGSTDEGLVQLGASTTTNQFGILRRFIATFDTSSLTSSAVISAAVASLAGEGTKQTTGLGTTPIHIVGATPASNNSLANSDYGQTGSTTYANVASASWVQGSSYNDFSLNASGISNISLTGISKFGWRLGWDYDNSFGGSWSSNADTSFGFWTADASGTSTDPKLVVTYTAPIAYTLTCAQGSYTLTGQSLTMTQALRMTMAQGSYTLTGFTLTMSKGYTLVAAMGNYVLTGFDLTMTKALIISLAQGAYTLTGQALTMTVGYVMSLTTGYYILTGFAAFFLGWFKRVKPSRGTYTPRTKPSIGSYTKRTKPQH